MFKRTTNQGNANYNSENFCLHHKSVVYIYIYIYIYIYEYKYIYIYMKGLDFHFKQCWRIIGANPTAEVEKAK